MTLTHAFRAALVTAAIAGAAALGTQVAQADAAPAATTGVTAPQATPSPTTTGETNPWD